VHRDLAPGLDDFIGVSDELSHQIQWRVRSIRELLFSRDRSGQHYVMLHWDMADHLQVADAFVREDARIVKRIVETDNSSHVASFKVREHRLGSRVKEPGRFGGLSR
jgi:hypothetical protein